MGYIFDGPNKLIILTPGTVTFSVTDLYSRWKDWVATSDNSKYLTAIRSIGGDPIGGGQNVSGFFFLNTVDGWRIRPQEATHELKVVGNLYSEDPNIPIFTPTLGGFTVTVLIDRSAVAYTVETGGGGGGTGPTAAEIADAVWDEPIAGHQSAGSAGERQAAVDVLVSSRAAPGAAMALTGTERDEIQAKILSDATPFPGARIDATVSSRASAGAVSTLTTNVSNLDARLVLVEKILRNKSVTNPSNGTMTIYDDDGVTPLLVAPIYEDVGGSITYRGQGANRRDRLT